MLNSDEVSELDLFGLSITRHCTIFKNKNSEINVDISLGNIKQLVYYI